MKEAVEDPICIIGYIEAGHGTRGKQRWLTTDEDLMDMYSHYSSRGEILLWTYSPQNTATSSASVTTSKKRPHSEEGRPSPECSATKAPRTTKFELHQKKMDELEVIYETLQDNHRELYTAEQLRAWAHLIQMKKHDSYEEPPNKPFFRNSRKTKPSTPPSEKLSDSNLTISPGKHVLMQGQLIDQISKLHDLLERGAISKVQYDKLQEKIMVDIEHF